MTSMLHRFTDRIHAGRFLARSLGEYADRPDVVVLGLPRGGVPVAAEVANALTAPLDVMVVRKLGVPGQEELAMGALASGGIQILNQPFIHALHLDAEDVQQVTDNENRELIRREKSYRGDRVLMELHGRTVILVDDGLATGSTMRAAAEAVRKLGAARVVLAAPVGSGQACESLEPFADEVVCPLQPEEFAAISEWYEDFPQTSDAEVQRLLREADRKVTR